MGVYEIENFKNNLGDFVSITVKKGGAEEGDYHQVDGITGGTITSDGVSDMLYNTLKIYSNYFSTISMNNNDTIVQFSNVSNNDVQ